MPFDEFLNGPDDCWTVSNSEHSEFNVETISELLSKLEWWMTSVNVETTSDEEIIKEVMEYPLVVEYDYKVNYTTFVSNYHPFIVKIDV